MAHGSRVKKACAKLFQRVKSYPMLAKGDGYMTVVMNTCSRLSSQMDCITKRIRKCQVGRHQQTGSGFDLVLDFQLPGQTKNSTDFDFP